MLSYKKSPSASILSNLFQSAKLHYYLTYPQCYMTCPHDYCYMSTFTVALNYLQYVSAVYLARSSDDVVLYWLQLVQCIPAAYLTRSFGDVVRIVFPHRKKTKKADDIVHKKFILTSELFDFGPLLVSKSRDK